MLVFSGWERTDPPPSLRFHEIRYIQLPVSFIIIIFKENILTFSVWAKCCSLSLVFWPGVDVGLGDVGG